MELEEKSNGGVDDALTHTLIDITYGELIKHAKEGLEKIKKKSKAAPLIIKTYTDWLQIEMERLEEEKKEGYYEKLTNQKHIFDTQETLKCLHAEYCEAKKKNENPESNTLELCEHIDKLKVTRSNSISMK